MWINSNNKLKKEFIFKNFPEAISFMVRVAFISEKNNHHPEIYNIYNKVEISLCTHDDGFIITEKDRDLAKKIDDLL